MRTTMMILGLAGAALSGCQRHATLADQLATGAPEICSAPEVESRVQALLAPDTGAAKALLQSGDARLRPSDIDAIAAGIGYQISEASAASSQPGAVSCSAQLSMQAGQYGVQTAPVTVAYRVTRAPAAPGYAVALTERLAREAVQAAFQQAAQRMGGIETAGDAAAARAALGAIDTPAVASDGITNPTPPSGTP